MKSFLYNLFKFVSFVFVFIVLINTVWALYFYTSYEMGEKDTVTSTDVPLSSRKIVASNLDLQEIWRYKTGYPNASPGVQFPPFLFVDDNKVIIPSLVDKQQNQGYLTALSQGSGQVIWQTMYTSSESSVWTDSAFFDLKMERLFLQFDYRVAGFDTKTGKQLWLSENLGIHTRYRFGYEQGDLLSLNSSASQKIILDPSSGVVLSRESTNHNEQFLSHDNFEIYVDDNGFMAFDQITGEKLLLGTSKDVGFWPSFVGDRDLIAAFGGPIYFLRRLNYQTGHWIWMSDPDVISNHILLGNRLYVLTGSGLLKSLDIQTGQVLGEMQFDTPLWNGKYVDRPFFLAINYPYFFVYFGDTQELVAFKFVGQ